MFECMYKLFLHFVAPGKNRECTTIELFIHHTQPVETLILNYLIEKNYNILSEIPS